MNHVPQLVEAFQHGNLALFLGDDLPQEITGLLSRADLAARLARRVGLGGAPPSWPDVAAQYEARAGLDALISWLRAQLEPAEHRRGPIYRLLAHLPVTTYMTTAYGTSLYDALREAGRRPNLPVVDASSLGLLDTGRPTVVQLLGIYDRPDSLVLTTAQMRQLPRAKAQILAGLVHPTLANEHILVLGQDLHDTYFQQMYQSALFQAGTIRPRAFAVWSGMAEWEKQTWLDQGVQVIETPALDLLARLLEASKADAPVSLAPVDVAVVTSPQPTVTVTELSQVPDMARPALAESAATLAWLHLSDLHFRKSQAYDENTVLNALLRDLVEQQVRPDFVAVSGDIAFSGQLAEYDLARRFFDDLLSATGLGKDRLFLVPGNHDVDRSLISTGARAIGDLLFDRKSANALLSTPVDRKLVFARFKGYAAFVKAYLGKGRRFDDNHYFYFQPLNLAGQRVALLGLNSAWLCASDQDKASGLLIGERQARSALEQADGADLKIALLHHPFDWLREFDQNDSAAMLTDGCDFILHGHLHQTAAAQLTSPDGAATILACGACYETREFPDMYNWVRLDLAAGTGTVYLRRYSDLRGGFWAKDTLTYKNAPDGMYTFPLQGGFGKSKRSSTSPSLARPWGETKAAGVTVTAVGARSVVIGGSVSSSDITTGTKKR